MSTFFDLLNGNVSMADLLAVILFVVGLQWLIGKLNLSPEPRLLYCNGTFLPKALMQAKVTEDEVREAIKHGGIQNMEQVEVVVLESNGHLSAIVRGAAVNERPV